jgi:hypothetical protein
VANREFNFISIAFDLQRVNDRIVEWNCTIIAEPCCRVFSAIFDLFFKCKCKLFVHILKPLVFVSKLILIRQVSKWGHTLNHSVFQGGYDVVVGDVGLLFIKFFAAFLFHFLLASDGFKVSLFHPKSIPNIHLLLRCKHCSEHILEGLLMLLVLKLQERKGNTTLFGHSFKWQFVVN